MGTLFGALAALTMQVGAQPACQTRLCFADALAPFAARVEASDRPLHILQIGDSHSAGDMITGAWRRRLQARHGYGGRGVLAAGRPYPGYLTRDVTAGQSRGWRVNASFGGSFAAGGAPLGLAGFTQTAHARGETLTLSADAPEQDFDRLVVCALTGPGAGAVVLRIGAAEAHWSLDAPAAAPVCRTLDSDQPAPSASIITADDGIVSVTSIATFRRDRGITLSNLGVTGSQLIHFGRTEDAVVAAELAAYRPDLIVLAFGTNEGFSPNLTADAYEAALRAQIGRIRRLTDRAVPILLLGPPDAARQAGRSGTCGGGWSVPRLLGDVRARQMEVARELGLGFWNWSAAMGGRCASVAWRRAGLMRPDHIHFTAAGADRIAAMLDADLTGAFGRGR